MNQRLNSMLPRVRANALPQPLWLDCYNQTVMEVCGTLTLRTDPSSNYWVAEPLYEAD